jgi:hypothetical protein
MYIVVLSIGRLYEHHHMQVPENVCDTVCDQSEHCSIHAPTVRLRAWSDSQAIAYWGCGGVLERPHTLTVCKVIAYILKNCVSTPLINSQHGFGYQFYGLRRAIIGLARRGRSAFGNGIAWSVDAGPWSMCAGTAGRCVSCVSGKSGGKRRSMILYPGT